MPIEKLKKAIEELKDNANCRAERKKMPIEKLKKYNANCRTEKKMPIEELKKRPCQVIKLSVTITSQQ